MSNAIVWFRQDLRISDNPAFTKALSNARFILPIYILDDITVPLGGAQRWWLHNSLNSLSNDLKKLGFHFCLRKGQPLEILKKLVQDHKIETIYWNRCYEPAAIARDILIKNFFQESGVHVVSSNANLLNEPWKITNKSGHFFKVFTPYWRHCLTQLNVPEPCSINYQAKTLVCKSEALDSWNLLPKKPNWASNFTQHWQPGENGANIKLAHFINNNLHGYSISRDEPAKNSTSQLSPHLHFGEISPWKIWRAIENAKLNANCDFKSTERFLAELGWREFSYHLLYHMPTLDKVNFKTSFNSFPWENNEVFLKLWQQGQTGYPIVDAGMRELWHTGYMHNRVRMIVASFLTKDLLIDWRLGAAWFLDTLVDADLASNSASWQWVAGCGADAAPYFRIFNPVLQGEKFDPDGSYIRTWVPELKHMSNKWIHKPWLAPQENLSLCLGKDYPKPMIDHISARKKALLYYKNIQDLCKNN